MFSRLLRRDVFVNRRLMLEQLEERVVFDAAPADAGNGDNSDQHQDTSQEAYGDTAPEAQQASDCAFAQGQSEPSDPVGDVLNQDLNVVLISNAVDQVEALSDAAIAGTEVIVYDAEQDDLGDIVCTLEGLVESTGQEIGQMAIVSHGASGVLSLGNGELWTVETLQNDSSEWIELGGLLSEDATIDLYGCNIGAGEEGTLFVETLASITHATIRASDDTTGNVDGADWDLEVTTAPTAESPLIDDAALEPGTIRLANIVVNAGDTYNGNLTGTDGKDTITINGIVTGDVASLRESDVIENNGTVGGRINAGDQYDTITNNGYVAGDIVGGTGEDLIVNNGTVDGSIYGVGQSDTIINTGSAGRLVGQGGNDSITTSGDVTTDIKAGAGNDTVSWYGGHIGGLIDGQTGSDDVLNLYVPAGTVSYTYSGTASAGTLTYDGETVKWTGFETLNITPPSAATTTANDDQLTIDEDHDVSFDVLANDTVSDTGGSLAVVSIDTSTMNFPDNLEEVANGQYIYHEFSTTAHIDHDYLAVGETATETFMYTVEDHEGVTSTATVTITFTGLNDDPQLWLQDDSGSVTEDSGDPLAVTGYYTIQDIDTTNTHTTTFSYNDDAVWSGGTLTPTQIATLTAGFSVDDGDPSDRTDQSWTYTVANADVEFLAGGETVVFSYDLTVEDTDGGTDTKTVTITIYGASGTASISGTITGSLIEDDATTLVSGSLTVTDPDSGEDVFQAVGSGDLQGTYGALTFDESTGDWTYTIDNSDPDTDALTQGEIVTDTLTVTSADGTANETIVITITGANDAPIATDDTVTTDEDVSYTFQATDFDFGDVDKGATFEAVRITDLPDEGTLY